MSTIVSSRAGSAHPRSFYRSPTNAKQRPITSMMTRRSHTDVFEEPLWRTSASRRRPRTGNINSTMNGNLSDGILHPDEVACFLQSLDRSDKFIVQVDCLANYRKLVETINLKQTPLDCKSLCPLQQRENRIVQRNACRDTRFRSLMDTLQPVKESELNDANHERQSITDNNDHE